LRHAYGKPDFHWLRVPEPVLRLAVGEVSSELLTSARVLPRRLLAAGFKFKYPTIDAALAAELSR
jgi:NAD dependent epimerase/dehydratase family enzyme